jgi:hypothetical protein
MTSITGTTPPSAYILDPSKVRTFPDAKPVSYVPERYSDELGKSEEDYASLTPDNRADNVWGRINLPNGDTVTIYNKGGIETDRTMLKIDWNLDTEAERAQAILDKYGGILKVEEPPSRAPEIGSDVAGFWSSVMGNSTLADRMLSGPDHRLVPDDWISDQA